MGYMSTLEIPDVYLLASLLKKKLDKFVPPPCLSLAGFAGFIVET